MARAKFLCDAERCIECNACVTACKNEHEVPWGINRRRVVTINDGNPGERSISLWPACIVQMLPVWRFVQQIAFIKMMKALCCTQKISVSVAATAFTPVRLVHLNSHKPQLRKPWENGQMHILCRWSRGDQLYRGVCQIRS